MSVSFSPPSSQLTISEVLSDASATGALEFRFPDPEIECAAVIEQFLTLITQSTVDRSKVPIGSDACDSPAVNGLRVYANLAHFMEKYDCERALAVFRAVMTQGEEFWEWEVFGIGVLLNDDELCTASVSLHAGIDSCGRKVRYLMPDDLPASVWVAMSQRYRYALVRFAFDVSRWFEITPMPVSTFFFDALKTFDAPKLHQRWRYGNVKLVSSDMWEFAVPDYVLLAAGHLPLRKPVNGSSQQVISFDDFETETKEVLEEFISLATDGRLLHPTNCSRPGLLSGRCVNKYLNVLSFLQRYCCYHTIQVLGSQIVVLMACGAIAPHIGFGFGVLAGDKNVCVASLSFYDETQGTFRGEDALPPFVVNEAAIQHPELLTGLALVESFVNNFGLYGYPEDIKHLYPTTFNGSPSSETSDEERLADWDENTGSQEAITKFTLPKLFLSVVGTCHARPWVSHPHPSSLHLVEALADVAGAEERRKAAIEEEMLSYIWDEMR